MRGVDGEKYPEVQAIAVFIRKGDIQAARMEITQYLRTHDDNPAAFYLLSMVESDPAEQAVALDRALTLDPTYERARKRLASIRPLAAAPIQSPTPAKPPRRSALPILLLLIVLVGIAGASLYLFTQSKAGENAFIYVCQMDGLDKDSKLPCSQMVAESMGTPMVGAAVNACANAYNVYLAENQRKSFTACVIDKSGVGATLNVISTNLSATVTAIHVTPTLSQFDRIAADNYINQYCFVNPKMDCEKYKQDLLRADIDYVHVIYCGTTQDPSSYKFGNCIEAIRDRR